MDCQVSVEHASISPKGLITAGRSAENFKPTCVLFQVCPADVSVCRRVRATPRAMMTLLLQRYILGCFPLASRIFKDLFFEFSARLKGPSKIVI